jgi:hemerythrin-like domain-containing protein
MSNKNDEKINISPLMINDHCKIEELLKIFEEKSGDDNKKAKKAFNNFGWKLEKHIFIEEKGIFSQYRPDDLVKGFKMLPELTKQHNYIINFLDNWRYDIRKKCKVKNISTFKGYLQRHRHFEEEKVYPKMDMYISEDEKKIIVKKINEIVQK